MHIPPLNELSQLDYERLHRFSLTQPSEFWGELATRELEWFTPFSSTVTGTPPKTQWFTDGLLNITHNCLDRHLAAGRGSRVAYFYTNERNQEESITYAELTARVCRAANALLELGVEPGDRVIIYMPLCPEQVTLMLACARIGAVHSVVYAGFSAEALHTRILDSGAKVVCTSSWTQRNGKRLPLSPVVAAALKDAPTVEHVLLHRRDPKDSLQDIAGALDYSSTVSKQAETCQPRPMAASDPLFILYTSGTTGTPKGIVHAVAGYSVYTHITCKVNFAVRPDQDVYWCTADTGWITGHSYTVYGPLSNGITSVLYEGSPKYPGADRWWELVDRYAVTQFYTAPTAIRLLMSEGSEHPAKYSLASLRIIGSVGEPLNPAAWEWYSEHIGHSRATVIDTWWQTETGGHLLGGLPFMPQAAGKAGLPFFGISPSILNERGNVISAANTPGELVISHPWPGALVGCWQNQDRYEQYWQSYTEGTYFAAGDFAQFDENGMFSILGRSDDVINVAGMRVGTAEVESALVAHPSVAEAGVISLPDPIQGEQIKAFVMLNQGCDWSEALETDLKQQVKAAIGYFAVPKQIEPVATLPKTRSGKIMRRVLKARELGLDAGDTSTLEA